MINIVLVDDHQLVRRGLRKLLETEKDFRISGEAGDGFSAIQLIGRIKPDVVILDLMIPHLNGAEAVRQILQRSPHTRVIICSAHSEEAYVLSTLRAGACAYVLKDSTPEDLIQAVRRVMSGARFLSQPLTEFAIKAYVDKTGPQAKDAYETLTSREREVLQLVARGMTNGEIAKHLSLGVRTVETHRANLMHKLGLRTLADLVRYAFERGIILVE